MQGQIGLLEEVEQIAKTDAAWIAWKLYAQNADMEIFTFKKWFIQKTFYLHDVKSVFEFLFGPQPV